MRLTIQSSVNVRIRWRPMPTWMLQWFRAAPRGERSGFHWTWTGARAIVAGAAVVSTARDRASSRYTRGRCLPFGR